MSEQLTIVLPTYNEIENLPRLVSAIWQVLPQASILVVDDNSPDGTGKWCQRAKQDNPRLEVLHRPGKQGLGAATLAGLQLALQSDASFIATMDADLSHSPEFLLPMWDAIKSNTDSCCAGVIGSRYVAGGKVVGWRVQRRWASWATNQFSRFWLGLPTCDNSGAFRIYRASALQKIELASIRNLGYGYLEEILWRLKQSGLSFIEFPITFTDRVAGKSKVSSMVAIKKFWEIARVPFTRQR